jgi:hypothetical protein
VSSRTQQPYGAEGCHDSVGVYDAASRNRQLSGRIQWRSVSVFVRNSSARSAPSERGRCGPYGVVNRLRCRFDPPLGDCLCRQQQLGHGAR